MRRPVAGRTARALDFRVPEPPPPRPCARQGRKVKSRRSTAGIERFYRFSCTVARPVDIAGRSRHRMNGRKTFFHQTAGSAVVRKSPVKRDRGFPKTVQNTGQMPHRQSGFKTSAGTTGEKAPTALGRRNKRNDVVDSNELGQEFLFLFHPNTINEKPSGFRPAFTSVTVVVCCVTLFRKRSGRTNVLTWGFFRSNGHRTVRAIRRTAVSVVVNRCE